jgi:hypothetical protein
MESVRVFMSFDRDRDRDLHERLFRQSRSSDSPFEVADWSGRGAGVGFEERSVEGDLGLRRRIQQVDAMIVICGEHTDGSNGVSAELGIAQDEGKPYFLIWGRREVMCTKPRGARPGDGMYAWLWDLLKFQVGVEMRKGIPRGKTA